SSKFQVRELLDSFLDEFDSYRLVTIGLIASLALNGSLFTDMMVEKVTKYIDKGNYSGYLSSVTWSVMITLVLISLLIYFVLNSFRAIKENTPSYSLVVVLSFLLAIVFNYLF
ncbi:LTA synthase family protein, partial [Enterococcus faecalis]|nr:LTA synthase family protein [Enterococcus faecalis]